MSTLLIWVWFLFRMCRFSGSLYFTCFLDTFVMDIMDFKVIYCNKVFSFKEDQFEIGMVRTHCMKFPCYTSTLDLCH